MLKNQTFKENKSIPFPPPIAMQRAKLRYIHDVSLHERAPQ
jgi:hypothetical protein